VRNKREQEVIQLKKALEDEVKSRETQLQDVRHKNTQQLEQVNVELDNTKKVRTALLSDVDSELVECTGVCLYVHCSYNFA